MNEHVAQGEIVTNKNKAQWDKILENDHEDQTPKITTDPISDKLAIVITRWLRVTRKREKIKEMFEETSCMNPDNVQGLVPVRINEMLYQKFESL